MVKIEGSAQVIAVIFIVLGMGLIYVGHQTSILQERVRELEWTLVEVGVTIDNGTVVTTHTVHLTKGATALEALRRVAVVETTYYTGLGEFIDSIDGIRNDPEAGMYWMWYIWYENEMTWKYAPVGAGKYVLKDGDNIKFRYEIPA